MIQRDDFQPVLLGAGAAAYGMARSFYEAFGLTSLALGARVLPICQDSAIVRAAAADDFATDQGFVAGLQAFAAQPGFAQRALLLVPTENVFARLLARHAAALPANCRFATASSGLVEELATKAGFYAHADRAGLPYPPFSLVTPDEGVDGEEPAGGFPAILKPNDPESFALCEYRGKKNYLEVRTRPELNYALSLMAKADSNDAQVLQREIPGPSDALHTFICYSDRVGRVRLMCQGQVVLEEGAPWSLGRFAVLLTGCDEEPIAEVKAFLEDLGYVGFCTIDAKWDPVARAFIFLDFNVAPSDTAYLATASGLNLAQALVADVLDGKGEASAAPAPCKVAAADAALLTKVPESTLRQYARNLEVWPRVRALMASGAASDLFLAPYDKGLKRWKAFHSDQHFHRREFADCYGRNHVND